MAWSVMVQAPRDEAKKQLKERGKANGLPPAVEKAIQALLAALPDTGIEAHGTVTISTHGQFRDPDGPPGLSNVLLSISTMRDDV